MTGQEKVYLPTQLQMKDNFLGIQFNLQVSLPVSCLIALSRVLERDRGILRLGLKLLVRFEMRMMKNYGKVTLYILVVFR